MSVPVCFLLLLLPPFVALFLFVIPRYFARKKSTQNFFFIQMFGKCFARNLSVFIMIVPGLNGVSGTHNIKIHWILWKVFRGAIARCLKAGGKLWLRLKVIVQLKYSNGFDLSGFCDGFGEFSRVSVDWWVGVGDLLIFDGD